MPDAMSGRRGLCSADSCCVYYFEQSAQYDVDPFRGIDVFPISVYTVSGFTVSAIFVPDCAGGSGSLLPKCEQDQCGGANGYGRMIYYCLYLLLSEVTENYFIGDLSGNRKVTKF